MTNLGFEAARKKESNINLVYAIEPLPVQYGINLYECVLKRIKIARAN